MYLDKWGLIVRKNPDGTFDGGDTCAEVGRYFFASQLQHQMGLMGSKIGRFVLASEAITINDKIVRHPAPGPGVIPPWNDPSDVSRDQLRPLLMAAGSFGLLGRVWQIYEHVRWLRYPNGDFYGPVEHAEYTRATGEAPNNLLDLGLFCAVEVQLWQIKKDYDKSLADDLNLFCSLAQSHFYFPTKTSREACKNFLQNVDVMARKALYYREGWEDEGKPIELVEIWRPIVDRMRKDLMA